MVEVASGLSHAVLVCREPGDARSVARSSRGLVRSKGVSWVEVGIRDARSCLRVH